MTVTPTRTRTRLQQILYFAIAISIYSSWCRPGSLGSAGLAICSALLLAVIAGQSSQLSYKLSYFCGVIVNILGFYWLADTIHLFGGFPFALSYPIFALFVIVSSLQFLLFAFLFNRLPAYFGIFKLALAWTAAEFLFPRIFPWELSHPLLGMPVLAQAADIAGTPLLSVLLLCCSSIIVHLISKNAEKTKGILAVSLILIAGFWIGYGLLCIGKFSNDTNNLFKIAVVQANVAVVQHGDMSTVKQNEQQYIELSQKIAPDVDLLIWPESVVQDWVWVDTKRIENDPRLPFFGPNTSLLTGALTFENQKRIFNSAMLIDKSGAIPVPYHKRILMPFGEYMPFSEILPWLNTINANLALFTPGSTSTIFEIPENNPLHKSVKISPLVCYEDLIPSLARTATQLGAEVLINLTNDAWFGNSPASIHHNLMASFRAIENRRYLVRSTNNGQTAIIDPMGLSIESISANSEGIIETNIKPLSYRTLFSDYFGPNLWWLITLTTLAVSLSSLRIKPKRDSRKIPNL